jgi:DNA-binding IclR family transcriptional regulator
MAQASAVRSVGRGLRILGAFTAERSQLSVGEIASALGVHMSTASRLAATLVAEGFLDRSAGGTFRLGPEVVRLGLLAAGAETIEEHARPAMAALAEESGETVVLSVPVGNETVDLAQVDSRFLVGGTSWVGRRLPLHATSDGKIFLAFGAAALPAGPLARVTPRTCTDRSRLEQELEAIRRHGWARAVGECEEGLNGVAAPVRSHAGRPVAALSVSGPEYRVAEDRLHALGVGCREAAAQVSARLGWRATTNGHRP